MVLSLGLYPDFDAVVAGALTPGVATELLRGEVGFRGVAISDDLGAGAVTAELLGAGRGRPRARRGHRPGPDRQPEDAEGVAKAIEAAVEDGEIEPERLAQAAERVIELKRKLGLLETESRLAL